MPLIETGNLSPIQDVTCACGARHDTLAKHYAHIGDCPIDRCAQCLTWLPDAEAIASHECAYLKVDGIRDILRTNLATESQISSIRRMIDA